jgi:hypothetical protein
MIDYLIATRAAIILWTTLAVMPAEIVFHAIEAELRRRGVEPKESGGDHASRKLWGAACLSEQNRAGRLDSREESWST